MFKKLLFPVAFAAAMSVGSAHAQDATNAGPPSVSQTELGAAVPAADPSGYGGTRARSASGGKMQAGDFQQPTCVGPRTFCDPFRGQ